MPNSMLISTLREEAASIAGIRRSTKVGWLHATKGIEHLKVEDFTMEDALKHRRELREKLQPRTLKTRIGYLSSIWNWGIDEHYVDSNPWLGMSKRIKLVKKRHPEFPFSHYAKFHKCPLFMAIWYHGFRVSEIANISSEEIVLDAPIPYFKLRHNKTRNLKNESSVREVPIYSGYLPFIIDRKLIVNNDWWKAGDNFSRYLKHHTGSSAHPIRHQFRSRMADADIEYSTQMALMGHLGEGMTARYGNVKLDTKLKALNKINASTKKELGAYPYY